MQGGDLRDLQSYWDCNISVVFPTLRLNTAKIIDYIEKCFKQKLHRIKFPAKNSSGSRSLSPPGEVLGDSKRLLYSGIEN